MERAFDRSPAGQRNRALFYGVDRIVYVEGGRDDKGVVESFDALFWSKIFSVFRPEWKLKMLPRGGKSNLIKLAREISSADDGKVIVAMDKDYDDLTGTIINKRNVIYTSGYSYENDIFHEKFMTSLFNILCPICDKLEEIELEIASLIKEFSQGVRRIQFADFAGLLIGVKVIDRDRIQKYFIGGGYGTRPELSRAMMLDDVKRASRSTGRAEVRAVKYRYDLIPQLSVGHLYASFCYKILCYLQKRHSNTSSLSRTAVCSGAIANFALSLTANVFHEMTQHYRDCVARC